MAEEILQLQLGDIIQINALDNETIYLITYIDNKQIETQDIVTLKKKTLLLDNEGELEDDSIESISLLSRDEREGYARQNGLVPKIWVNVTLEGDLPAIFTGEITNLEEDMIEITTFPEKETIYIDFAYKGIPKDIPIKSIDIRDPPDLELVIQEPREEGEITSEEKVAVPEVKQELKKMIIQADDIIFGSELGEVSQEVAVGESYERYGIQTQTNDLLDELLATIPNAKRTTKVLNIIHLMIERFKELRSVFSEKDEYGNPIKPITKSANYKPLVNSLKALNKNLTWIIPVVKNRKKVYDVDEDEADMVDDIYNRTMGEMIIQDATALERYASIPDSENKYDYLLKTVDTMGTPYEAPRGDGDSDANERDFLTRQHVEANITTVVDNLDDLYSSVVVKESLNRKRYLMTKYNLGFSKLETVVEQGSKPYNKRVIATPANKIHLKSLILLPEDVIRYSRVNLPGSSILEKSALNFNPFYYYKRFTKDSSINTEVVESFDTPLSPTFLEGSTEIVMDDSLSEDKEKYEKYLQSVIPRTKILFNSIKKYIDEKLTLGEVVKMMEPFLIYTDDLTYKQYMQITLFIKKKISEYKKTFVARGRNYRALQSGKKFADKTWYSLFSILSREKKNVLEDGYGLKMKGVSSSENYHKIMEMDSGRLFMTAVALENLLLMTPVDINEIFERERLAINDDIISETDSKSQSNVNPCANYTLVKRYLELDELLDDNNKTIYVDKNLDQTRYDIAEEYVSERETMATEEFEDFLKDKLIANVGLSEETAQKDAAAMVAGKRSVVDGEYASLQIDGGEKTYYYRRNGNQWERDETIPEVKMDESEFCNIQTPCIKVKDDCVTNENAEMSSEKKSLEAMVKEFDITYEVSKEDMTRMIQNRFSYYTYRLALLKKLRFEEKTKYNDRDLKMGLDAEEQEDVLVSPYAKLRDAIFGQQDMVKRNSDIVRFYTKFTRNAIEENGEDPYWCYCTETNVKLMPVFLYTLAATFVENQYDYVKVLDQICAKQGKLSDDGNAWVDEHSGYIIKQVSFDTDEGYEESGFRVKTRDVIQEDLQTIRLDELEKKFNDPNAEKINNVIQAMASYMGFSVESMQEFVIRNTLLITAKIVPSEPEYNKKREALAKKGKKVPSYEDAFHTSMMLVTFVYLLVGIQTSIPSIKTRKQFPGCKKSFEGFPLDGSGDDSGLVYIACVANKIKSGVAPWNVLKKMNATGIAKRMKDLINKYVVPDTLIQTLFNEKRNYMLEEKDSDIPIEHDISKWQTFLPPLVRITTTPHDEITDEFKEELMRNIRAGKSAQEKQIRILESMMIHYPMVMIEEIQKVITKEIPLLTTIANEAFLENACCIDPAERTTINYFMSRIPSLQKYNTFVKQFYNITNDIKSIALAPRIFSPIDTRRMYPKLSSSFSKKTIYQTFIHYCNFGTLFPIPENIQPLCMSKPDDFSLFDSLHTQITKLEEHGTRYSLDDMNRLLYIINRENTITVSLYDDEKSAFEKLRVYLRDDTIAIPQKLHAIMSDLIDTFDLDVDEPTSEMKKLVNYLDREVNEMKTTLVSFLQRNSNLSPRKFNQTVEVLQRLHWNGDSTDETNIKTIDFLKNQIYELTQVFPNMVVNEVDYYDDVIFPSHWSKSLSERHISDLSNIIYSYYKTLGKFYGKKVLSKMLENITAKTALWRDFCDVLPVFERIEREGDDRGRGRVPTFNTEMLVQMLEYIFLQCLTVFMKEINDASPLGLNVPTQTAEDEMEAVTVNEIINEDIGNISEIDIISGEKLQRSELMASFLLDVLGIFGNTKKLLNYTYTDIIYRVNVSKEKEKDQFTKRLKELSDEEREIENMMKNHKLGVWSKGLSKGVTQYEADTYDEERRDMERIIALEQEVGKQDFVTDMNRDIFLSEAAEAAHTAARIEAEVNRIDYMGEDADFEEFGMDGDEMY